jgi:hypothetical protein
LFYIRVFTLVSNVFAFSYITELTIEPYNDYVIFYLRWVPALWSGAWPYTLDMTSRMISYSYPPLWIYTIGLLGSTPPWLPGLVLLTFNIATGAVVYGISRELTHDEKRSVFAMMLFLLNPFTLVYGSYLWLNPTPYVFFVALSFYLALRGRKTESVIGMAVAVLYKQFAIVFFPVLVIVLVKQDNNVDLRRGLVAATKHGLIYSSLIGLASIPFLLVDASAYIGSMFVGGSTPESLAAFHPELSWPVNFNTFFVWIGVPGVIAWAIAYLLAYYILLGLSLILIYISFARFGLSEETEAQRGESRAKKVTTEAIFWSILMILALHQFFPRGSYKFYLLALIPFISILFDYRDLTLERTEPFHFQKHYLMPMVVSWVVFVCFRLVYFWILLVWALFYLHKGNRTDSLRKYVRRSPRMAKVLHT